MEEVLAGENWTRAGRHFCGLLHALNRRAGFNRPRARAFGRCLRREAPPNAWRVKVAANPAMCFAFAEGPNYRLRNLKQIAKVVFRHDVIGVASFNQVFVDWSQRRPTSNQTDVRAKRFQFFAERDEIQSFVSKTNLSKLPEAAS